MLRFTVKKDRCNGCGACVADCPAHIIQLGGDHVPFVAAEREANCFACRHCLAVCPTGAISVYGLDPDKSLPVGASVWPSYAQMTHLVRGRRSVRQYEDRDVDRRLIDELLATVANAPTGANSRALTFRVIDDRQQMQKLREAVMTALFDAAAQNAIPDRCAYLRNVIDACQEFQADIVFRGAPHLLIVSTPPQTPCATEDVPIALAYFELLAQSAGLGTVWCGLLHLAFESVPSLKRLVGLPPEHHYYAMLFGYPAVRYARTLQRDDAATVERVTVG